MADKEYIEAKKVLRILNELVNDCPDKEEFYNRVFEEVDAMPAADVVEVVRCKDCVWWEARTYGSCIGKCENPSNGLWDEYLYDSDYCSYGERKEQT